ncbi:hypothetical protein L249_4537 [Ophiocordyceps polyrhachis-furcata BCC 54312]|uniref:Uncharacterized protein n=1 Tax=Ophiocordyceps polyrhachis-furcata BCC 54312 TaxID=1330021 RepID=A0A367KZU6_9HYPO|nr:hypothetical protein L249_4537 [Ophiocordyceps polyrhachis-furcata BCC 54312]
MHLAACLLVLCARGLQAKPDFGQVSRCFFTAHTGLLTRTVQNFFRDASSCVASVQGSQVLSCAQKSVPDEVMTLMLPMIDTIRAWEEYYGETINSAFLQDQSPSGRPIRFTAWDELLSQWKKHPQVCYHFRSPSYMDHLIPSSAGLLSLFYLDDDFQRPVLKSGTHWQHHGPSVCSGNDTLDRARQESAVSMMVQRSIMWDKPRRGVELDRGYLHYLDLYSTDPFLQAVITNWQSVRRRACPRDVRCDGSPVFRERYMPLDGDDYLVKVKMTLKTRRRVCLIHQKAADIPDAYLIVSPHVY